MTTPFLPLTQSTEMPLITGWMNEALEALSDETHLDFLLFRTSIATRQALHSGFIDTGLTVKALQEDMGSLYTRLMLAIPRPVARSIVRHTVAYDSVSGAASGEPLYTYSRDHKGVYVASMAISGRGGKFLKKSELEELIRRLQEYIRAVKVYLKDGAVWKSAADRKVVADVDNMFRVNLTVPGLRWVTTGNLPKVEAMVKMLEGYKWDLAVDGVPMKQCPLMVGCSQNAVGKRCYSHTPPSGMSGTTATWGLTLCLIKAMGLTPEVRTLTVLTTVEKEELPAAERLVTALAQSLVSQDGFNIVDGGGSSENDSAEPVNDAKRHIYGEMSWLSDHTKSVINETRRRIALSDAASKKHRLPGLVMGVIERFKASKKMTEVELEKVLVMVEQFRKELREAELAVVSRQKLWGDSLKMLQDTLDDLEEIDSLLRDL
jgi:hypothetical protein